MAKTKLIPRKLYSLAMLHLHLAMLHLHHRNHLNHAQPRLQAKQLFHTFDVLKLFQLSRNLCVSHGHNTMGGIEYGSCGEDKKKVIVSHQLGVSTGCGDAHQ